MGTIVETLVSPISAIFRRAARSTWRRLPHPTGTPTTHSPGPDADRLLLMGSSLAMGYGVLSHDLALGGCLARRLSERTGRGVTVDILANPEYTLDQVLDGLDSVRVGRFDALVLCFNGAESGRPVAAQHWRRSLERVLAEIDDLGFGALHVFVIGLPFISAIPGPFGVLARRRAVVLNRQSELACAEHPNSSFLTVDEGPDRPTAALNRSTYNSWANAIASPMAHVLNAIAGAPLPLDSPDERRRQAAVDAMQPASERELAELAEVLTTARHLFGVKGAAITIIDGNQQIVRCSSGIKLEPSPRSGSVCDVTILEDRALVVQDLPHDRRFRDRVRRMTFVPRFYAGYPLEAGDGERVGAFCLLGDEPRSFSRADTSLLRDLALRAQSIMVQQDDSPHRSHLSM